MKPPKCRTCGKEHSLGVCPEFRQRLNVDFRHEGANAQATVQSGNVTVVGNESGTLTPPKPKMGRPRTGYIKAEYNRQYSADQRTIKRLGLEMTVKEWREKNDS